MRIVLYGVGEMSELNSELPSRDCHELLSLDANVQNENAVSDYAERS